jgi:hypothetical protein
MFAEIIEAPISSPEQYEQIRERTATNGTQGPAGAILHVAGPAQGGGWRIITVWESREAASRFGDTVQAARSDLGLEGEACITRFEVHNLQQNP